MYGPRSNHSEQITQTQKIDIAYIPSYVNDSSDSADMCFI